MLVVFLLEKLQHACHAWKGAGVYYCRGLTYPVLYFPDLCKSFCVLRVKEHVPLLCILSKHNINLLIFISVVEAKEVSSTGTDTVEESFTDTTDSPFFRFFFFGGRCHQHRWNISNVQLYPQQGSGIEQPSEY